MPGLPVLSGRSRGGRERPGPGLLPPLGRCSLTWRAMRRARVVPSGPPGTS